MSSLKDKIANLAWYDLIAKLKDILGILDSSALLEAPIDGEIYGRQDGDWVVAGGSGGSQNLDQTLTNGNTSSQSINLLDIVNSTELNTDGLIVSDIEANTTSISINKSRILGQNNVSNNYNYLNLCDRTEVGNAFYRLDPNKTANTGIDDDIYTIAIIEDISLQTALDTQGYAVYNTGNQILAAFGTGASETFQVQNTIPTTDETMQIFSDVNGLLIFGGKISTPENIEFLIKQGDLTITKTIGINNTVLKFLSPVTTNATIQIPAPLVDGDYTLATEDWVTTLLDANRNQGVYTLTLDGVSSVYTIPHGLGVVPSFAHAGRGASTNFDVFNTTWDATNIIITYQNPPLAGSLNINWIALKP